MSDYTAISYGGCVCGGCAIVTFTDSITLLFGVGDTLFVKRTAQLKGQLEKVWIKRVDVYKDAITHNQTIVRFIDSTNRIWRCEELIPYSTAISTASIALERQLRSKSMLKCS